MPNDKRAIAMIMVCNYLSPVLTFRSANLGRHIESHPKVESRCRSSLIRTDSFLRIRQTSESRVEGIPSGFFCCQWQFLWRSGNSLDKSDADRVASTIQMNASERSGRGEIFSKVKIQSRASLISAALRPIPALGVPMKARLLPQIQHKTPFT